MTIEGMNRSHVVIGAVVAAVLAAVALGLLLFFSGVSDVTERANGEKSEVCSAAHLVAGDHSCVRVDAFQPSAEQAERLDTVYSTEQPDAQFSVYGDNQSMIIVDGIPYSQYWQLDDPTQYVLHPMRVGSYIFHGVDDPEIRATIPAILDEISTELPNGGAAFYYPNVYPLNRMRGPDYMYSAISQGQILGAFVAFDQAENSVESAELLERVKEAMFFEYWKGGINLSGVALLELPLFRSNPEIILNGWLHALLFLSDYAEVHKDRSVAEFVRANLVFFVENNDVWYDEDLNISLYSDTSPQRIILAPSNGIDEFEFSVVYVPRSPELDSYVVDPVVDEDGAYGAFDNRIIHMNRDAQLITANVNCSGLLDTRIVGNGPFSLRARPGGYDPTRSTPDGEGEWQEIESYPSTEDGLFVADLSLGGDELICGYPTNFAKYTGRNYYHIYHVVALLYLAEYGYFDDADLKQQLSDIAGDWYRNTARFEYRTVADFEDPQVVLDGINWAKPLQQVSDARALFTAAGIDLFPEHQP